jgi:natural product precursor
LELFKIEPYLCINLLNKIIDIKFKYNKKMKKVGFLKLTQLNKVELEERQMNALRGGESCSCGCGGPSNIYTNTSANYNYSGETCSCGCTGNSSTINNANANYNYAGSGGWGEEYNL